MHTVKPKAKRHFVRLQVLVSEEQIERAKAIAASLPYRDTVDVDWRDYLSAVAKVAIDSDKRLNTEEAPVHSPLNPPSEIKP